VGDVAAEVGVDLVGDVADADAAVGVGRAVDVVVGHRAALGLVGVEPRRVGPSLEDPRQLPPEVVAIADRGVHAGAAAGADLVGGVTHEEHVPVRFRCSSGFCCPGRCLPCGCLTQPAQSHRADDQE